MDIRKVRKQIEGKRTSAREAMLVLRYVLGIGIPLATIMSSAFPATAAVALASMAVSGGLLGTAVGATPWRALRGPRASRVRVPIGTENGLVLGIREDGSPLVWTRREMAWHGLMTGKPGSGKTVQLKSLAAQTIFGQGSGVGGGGVLFLDAKPSLRNLQEFLWLAQQSGRESDFRALIPAHPEYSHSFNPIQRGSVEQKVSILSSLRKFEGNSATEYYQGQQRVLLTRVIDVLDTWRRPYHMGDVQACIMRPDAREKLLTWGPETEARTKLRVFLDPYRGSERGAERFNEVMSGLVGSLDPYITSTTGRILLVERGEIDLFDVVKQQKILYVAIPTATAEASAWCWALLVLKSMMACIGRLIDEGHKPEVPFLALLDELAAYMTPDLALMFALAREANVALLGGLQSISQMQGAKDGLDAQILDNTGCKSFFCAGGWDGAELAAAQLGKGLKLFRTASMGNNEGRSNRSGFGGMVSTRSESASLGVRETYHYEVPPEDLLELPVGMMYHKHSGGHDLVRTPLFEVPDDELPPLEFKRYSQKPENPAGLYDEFIRRRTA